MFNYFYKRPYALYTILASFLVIGITALITLPKNLFPDANPPQIIVITSIPGATAQVAANTISKPIEEEIARLGLVTNVSSTNIANFSIVKADFDYAKDLNAAAVDVANALSVAKGKLPTEANPAVYTAGDFVLPVDIIAISPKDSSISIADIRKIAESFIKPYLLSNSDIGNVELFGGFESAINIEIDPFKAKEYQLNFETITKVIQSLNKDIPVGFVKSDNSFYTITYYGEKSQIEQIKNINIQPNVKLKDVAAVNWGSKKRTSSYIGNGKPSIALAIQRAPKGSVLEVSKVARDEMEKLKIQYPNLNFEIADTQRDLIELSNANMLDALKEAILLTLVVVLFFLGNFRAILTAGLSIPLVFFGTMAIIWLTGGELNMVIYTAIILALGMLTDDTVVVLENVERHMRELGEDLETAIVKGTKEVINPVLAGTFATAAVLFPLMFVGGFPEKIYKPLIFTLLVALFISYFVAITFIPQLLKVLYKNGFKKNKVERWFDSLYTNSLGKLVTPYINVIKFSNGKNRFLKRFLLTGSVVLVLVITIKTIMPIIGKDAMPPMDTGIIKAQIGFSANETVESSEKKIMPFLKWLHEQEYIVNSSVAFGTEAGVLSLGNGNLPSEATLTIYCVNRFDRKLSIWEIENIIREKLSQIEGVKRNDVFDFGATALSSVKAPVSVRVKSAFIDGLNKKTDQVVAALSTVKGLTSISKSWDKDVSEIILDIDQNKALSYGVTPGQISAQIPVKGQIVGLNANLQSMNTQLVRLYMKGKFSENEQTLRLLPIQTPFGEIPLAHFAQISKGLTYTKIERDKMLYSVDVNGYRTKRPITHLTDDVEAAIDQQAHLNDVEITQAGDVQVINDSFSRIVKAVGFGVLLLLMMLIMIYKSVKMAFIMILVLPMSLIGAAWGMLLFDKPSCMPSLLGILLLFSIIIKNAVLLIDFYQQHRASGESPFESAIETVKVRFRPVLMTAFATIAGMIPIAMENAVGLERLSPLADVAIGGLLIGTLLTLIYVPIYAYSVTRNNTKPLS